MCVQLHHILSFAAQLLQCSHGPTSPARPVLENHLWHLCFATIVQVECLHVLFCLVLLTLPRMVPVAQSPVRSNYLPFVCPRFCHVNLF